MPRSDPKFKNSDGAYAHGPSVSNVAGSAGGSFTTAERDMVNNLVTAVNAILAALRSNGTIAS